MRRLLVLLLLLVAPWQADSGSWLTRCMVFSPDGHTLATGGSDENERDEGVDGSIHLWDVDRGTLLATLAGQGSRTDCLRFSADGRYLVSAGPDVPPQDAGGYINSCGRVKTSSVRLWRVASRKKVGELPLHGQAIAGVTIAPDGAWVEAATPRGLVRWSVGQTPRMRLSTRFACLGQSPNGRRRAGSSPDGIVVWDDRERRVPAPSGSLLEISDSGAMALAFPDGVKVWHDDLKPWRSLSVMQVSALRLVGHRLFIAAGGDHLSVVCVDLDTGASTTTPIRRPESYETCAAFSADGTSLGYPLRLPDHPNSIVAVSPVP